MGLHVALRNNTEIFHDSYTLSSPNDNILQKHSTISQVVYWFDTLKTWNIPSPQGFCPSTFYSHTHFPLAPTPPPPHSHFSVLRVCHLVMSRMLCKWNHIACRLWGCPCLWHNSLEIHSGCCVYNSSFSVLSSIPWDGYTTFGVLPPSFIEK